MREIDASQKEYIKEAWECQKKKYIEDEKVKKINCLEGNEKKKKNRREKGKV